MSWVVAAVGTGLVVGGTQAVTANQTKQRNKGYISAAYRSATDRMSVLQGDTRQSTAEAMNARGMGGSGSAVRAAMVNGHPVSLGATPGDLAGQSQTDLGKEFALERSDLDNSYTRALNENKATALNSELGAVATGVQAGANVYTGGKELGALHGAPPAAASSAARQAYMSGIDDPANTWGGIHPIDPLNAPGSSWNRKTTTLGVGQANYDFNTGNG